ncbi:glutamyl-tRNA reductase [Phycisphaeraceae bacterium D3-23]
MRILMVGLNHKTADVAAREALAMDTTQAGALLRRLREEFDGAEAVLISTCNRTELYVARPVHAAPDADGLRRLLAEQGGVDPDTLAATTLHREQEQAALHLFHVCAGLDSMVLGEPQVQGQVRRAYELAQDAGCVGPVLHRLFQGAIAAGKQARNETGIDAGRTSVSSVAVAFASNIFDHFNDKTVAVIGAGEMIKGAAHALLRERPGKLWIVNRSPQCAAELAQDLAERVAGGTHIAPRPWADLDGLLVEADIVVSCTGANEPVVLADGFRPLLKRRRNRPLFMIDMAVPRDIDPAIGAMNNVYLYNLDDLQQAVGVTTDDRHAQRDHCERILHDACARCMGEIRHRDLGALVKQLRTRLERIADDEQQRTQRKLAAQGVENERHDAVIKEHNHRLISKILHLPLSQLDRTDPDAPLGFYAAALRRLFDLEDEPTLPDAPSNERPASTPEDGSTPAREEST